MIPPFVKKFDFRGVYEKDIKDADAYYLGLAVEKTIQLKKVLVGWDTRTSSKNLAINFINALSTKGIAISTLDKCPIDYVTAASYALDYDLSVMFTGSHNPWTWSGLLMHTKGGASVSGPLVDRIVANYYTVTDTPLPTGTVAVESFPSAYTEVEALIASKIQSLIPLREIQTMKIVVDVGDGSGSRSLSLLEKLLPQVSITRIHDRQLYDEHSSHVADPSNSENMKDLIKAVTTGSYACGFAFDSDSDRVLAVDEHGDYMDGSLLGSAMIQSLIDIKAPVNIFGYAVDCGPSIYNTVTNLKEPAKKTLSVEAIPVGRSLVRNMIREEKVDFAVENVGHFYSKDFFMTDSGIFSLAIILHWISHYGSLSTLKEKHPDGERIQISSASMSKDIVDTITSTINEKFKDKTMRKIEVDGERYEFFDGEVLTTWYAIRKSGYEPITKIYFGSLDPIDFKYLNNIFKSLVPNLKSL